MKKKIIALLLAVITIIHICVPALPVIAEEAESGNDDTSVVGSFVRFSTSNTLVYMYKSVSESGPSSDAQRISASDLPDVYVVLDELTVSYGTQFYKLGTTDGSSNEILDTYPWVKAVLMEIVPDPDADLIKGQVDLTDGSNKLSELVVTAGEKEYVFTNLGSELGDKATYCWQLLVDKESNRWANIADYFYPYAVVTEALILNSLDEDGKATMRCIVTEGENKYVSNKIKISLEQPVALLSEAVASNEIATYVGQTPKMLRSSQRAATDAFQITIEYVYLHENAVDPTLNGSTAANTLTITLPPGAGFDNAITSPPIAGYKPYVEWQDGDSTDGRITYGGKQLIPADEVAFENQTEGIHVTVYYVPQTVSYRVKYYKQNLQDDEYVEWKTEFKTGIADTSVADDLAVSEPGFSPLYYEKSTCITSDGNAVVEIYYDRIYYLVEYNIGEDAYGVTPNYVRYGTTLMLGNPINPGYTFNGWQLTSVKNTRDGEELLTGDNLTTTYQNYNVTAANSQITVAHNLVYTAQWVVGNASYTIIFWAENANDNGYSIWTTQTVTGAQSGSTIDVSGTRVPTSVSDRNYFTYNEALSDKTVTVKGDGTAAANIYYTRNIYHIVFTASNNQGATACRIAEHTHGTDCCSLANCDHTSGACHLAADCTIGEHTHNDSCGKNFTCSIEEHKQHTDACCSKEVHTTHTASCYNNVGAANTNSDNIENGSGWWGYSAVPTNPADGVIYQREDGIGGDGGDYDKVIYIGGTWYLYNGTESSGTVISSICHKHSDGTCTCTKELHAHQEGCYTYSCGKEEHEHVTDSCIKYEHSHNDCTRYLYVLSAKYNADIAEDWPTATEVEEWKALGWLNSNVYYQRWTGQGNWATKRVDMTSELCNTGTSRTYTLTLGTSNSAGTNTVKYMFESIDQTPGDGKVLRNGIYYEENTRYTQSGLVNDSFSAKEILGMENVATGGTLYYTRNSYTLTFVNGGVSEKSVSIKYEAPLTAQYYVPDIPSTYEEKSVTFAGWYTTQVCADGTEFDFSTGVMPAGELYLYAKWVPTEWNVEVYLDEDKKIPLYSDTLPFGSMIPEPSYKDAQEQHSDYKDLIWAGWYYKDAAGNEVRFDFNTMALKTNYNGTVDPVTGEQYPSAIYAKWTSEIPIAYTVYYVTEDENGDYVNVADPTEGVALAGINKSFFAKSGEDIYTEYHGYLPTQRSITHQMSITASDNVIYFKYVTVKEITYTVKHVFKSDDFVALEGIDTYEVSWQYKITTSDSDFSGRVVISFDNDLQSNVKSDDHWDIIKNLSPNAYKQELVVTAGGTNEVVFYWETRSDVFLYQVIHYFEKLNYSSEDEKYTAEYYQEFVGAYGDGNSVTVYATPIDRQGFTMNSTESVLEMTLNKTDAGSKERVLAVYYDRNTIQYTVQYIYGGTVESAEKEALYEQVVTETAKDIEGYVIADPAQAEQSVSITYAGQMIQFYYVAQQVIYNYQVIDNVGGYLSIPQETVTIGMAAIGAEPEAAAGYIFIGWYTDEDATTKVSDAWVDASGKLTPVPSVTDANKVITYYAKFAPNSLTIWNGFADTTDTPDPALDLAEQGFIYTIQGVNGTSTQGVYLRVAVLADESRTILALPVGEYVVTVEGEWSWRWRYTSVEKVSTSMADGTQSQETAISNMSWTLTFTGSGEMQVVYAIPGADIVGATEGDGYYYVTDNAYN